MRYALVVNFEADSDDEAESIAADIEQTLSGQEYFGQGEPGVTPVFPHPGVTTSRVVEMSEGGS